MKFLMIKLQAPGGILLCAIAGTYLPVTGGTHLSATGGTPRASRAFMSTPRLARSRARCWTLPSSRLLKTMKTSL